MVLPSGDNEIQNNQTNQEITFGSFFERWLIDQDNYLRDLLRLVSECSTGDNEEHDLRCRELISHVMVHYNQYYEAKARLIRENVFSVLMPTWLSSFERAYLWIGGFRPGLAFRLVFNNVPDLTEDQSQRINRLMTEVKQHVERLSNEFNRVQEGMASPTIVELARHLGRPLNGATEDMESTVGRMKMAMEALVGRADFLRRMTGTMLVEILKPSQAVKFLAAASHLRLVLRRWGLQRDGQNRGRNDPAHS